MLIVNMLSPSEQESTTPKVRQMLERRGFYCCNLPPATYDRNTVTLALISKPDPNQFFEIGLRIGRGERIICIGNNYSAAPAAIGKVPFLSMTDRHFEIKLLEAIGEGNIETDDRNQEINIEKLLKNLSEDPNAYETLSSRHIVALMSAALRQLGFAVEASGDGTDLSCERDSSNYFVHCMASGRSERLGVEKLRVAYSRALASAASTVLVVSNGRWSSAAIDWASMCIPSVHLIERQELQSYIGIAAAKLGTTKAVATEIGNGIDNMDHMWGLVSPSIKRHRGSRYWRNAGPSRSNFWGDVCILDMSIDNVLGDAAKHLFSDINGLAESGSPRARLLAPTSAWADIYEGLSQSAIVVAYIDQGTTTDARLRACLRTLAAEVKKRRGSLNCVFVTEQPLSVRLSMPTSLWDCPTYDDWQDANQSVCRALHFNTKAPDGSRKIRTTITKSKRAAASEGAKTTTGGKITS